MIPPPTSKGRALGIRLDYFKSPSAWERRKGIATVVAVAAAAAWWTAGVLLGRQNAAFNSPGAVAAVHRIWESKCDACHPSFPAAVRDDAACANWADRSLSSGQKCQACHRGADHHPLSSASEAPWCSSCHKEHRGAQASLVALDDRMCTRCHQDVARTAAAETTLPADALRVTRFDAEHHPQFTSIAGNQKHLKFSHQRHLAPGIAASPDDKNPMTLGRFPKGSAQRKRYGRGQADDSSLVQLDCSSCHQLDGDDPAAKGAAAIVRATQPARPASGYMLPILYENQCQACHPLYESPGVVQHRQTPAEIRASLGRTFAQAAIDNSPKLLRTPVPPESLPGARLPGSETLKKQIDRNVAAAERKLADSYCGKCHEFEAGSGEQGAGSREFASPPPAPRSLLPPVVPPNVPQVWYLHARFDHRAHRAMNCLECHAIVPYNDVKDAEAKIDVQLPRAQDCLRCHGPASGDTVAGGARFDCVECHRYHNGSMPLAGGGSQAGSPVRKLSIQEFQAGTPDMK